MQPTFRRRHHNSSYVPSPSRPAEEHNRGSFPFRTIHEADMRPPRVQLTSLTLPIFNHTSTKMDLKNNPLRCPDEKKQYPEEDIHPLDWAKSKSACLGLIQFGQVHHYCIHTLNAPGNLPAVNGQPPFMATPFTTSPEHRDMNGSLGAFEWTQLPQFMADTQYSIPCRAFITRTPANLTITATCSRLSTTLPVDHSEPWEMDQTRTRIRFPTDPHVWVTRSR